MHNSVTISSTVLRRGAREVFRAIARWSERDETVPLRPARTSTTLPKQARSSFRVRRRPRCPAIGSFSRGGRVRGYPRSFWDSSFLRVTKGQRREVRARWCLTVGLGKLRAGVCARRVSGEPRRSELLEWSHGVGRGHVEVENRQLEQSRIVCRECTGRLLPGVAAAFSTRAFV